jgi:hypothetical protein
MKTKQPCELCPCKPTVSAAHRGILRSKYDEIKASGGFPCHERNPHAHALTDAAIGEDGKYHVTDCAGYKLWGLTEREEA